MLLIKHELPLSGEEIGKDPGFKLLDRAFWWSLYRQGLVKDAATRAAVKKCTHFKSPSARSSIATPCPGQLQDCFYENVSRDI